MSKMLYSKKNSTMMWYRIVESQKLEKISKTVEFSLWKYLLVFYLVNISVWF